MPCFVQAGDDLMVIDQQRRSLIAEAGARAAVDTEATLRIHLPGLNTQALAQALEQRIAAEHAVGDVVGKQHPYLAHRLRVQKAVEARHAFDMGTGQAQFSADISQQFTRQPVGLRLGFAQDLHQRMGVASPAGDHGVGDNKA
jgi:hypothetical protein